MFKDKVRVKIGSGSGGDGVARIDKSKRPAGGNGGDGGNLYIQGDESIYDLSKIETNKTNIAGRGELGGKNNNTGSNGKDLILRVPLATVIYDNHDELLLEVTKHNQRHLVFEGGLGGLGNGYYKGKGYHKREKTKEGKPGKTMIVTMELELQSDIIFIGLPNVGKSSVLRELTNADAKVADYAFTTIDPQLGRAGEITLMDLPGLIEGTYTGKGVGTRFVKHTKRAKLVAHFVSADSEDPLADYKAIRQELEHIDPGLAAKPEIVVITKSDMVSEAELTKITKSFKKHQTVVINMFEDELLSNLLEVFSAAVGKAT